MKKLGMQGIRRGKRCRTTVADDLLACPADKVNRQFVATRPNQLWVADITFVATWTGFVSVGDSYDNALAETINGLYKTEVIRHRGPWRNIDDVEFATLEWVDWFNNHNRRLLEPIGNIPPAEFEMAYYRQLREPTNTV